MKYNNTHNNTSILNSSDNKLSYLKRKHQSSIFAKAFLTGKLTYIPEIKISNTLLNAYSTLAPHISKWDDGL